MPKTYTIQQLTEAVNESFSIAQVLRRLNLKAAGGNYQSIKTQINKSNLDTSHFTGQGWSKGKTRMGVPRKSLSDFLRANSPCNSWHLKKRLFKENLLEERCYRCGLTEWMGQSISLELEHINGDHNDNRIENLTILCPNCHAQTPTYRGKNMRV